MAMRSDHASLELLSAGDGRYAFERKLGEGGAGAVYLVRDRETGEQLALKRLHRTDDRSITRLKREFRSLADINHRNVIRLYDLGRAVEGWFLTMEYVDGTDLLKHLEIDASISAILKRGGDVPELDSGHISRVVVAFHQLASGIQALHQAGVLHRDLKPSNVLVAQQRVVVLDFGLALELREADSRITMEGTIAGTPAYMAPEQVRGSDVGQANDWYSYGVMLYEALSGCLPIEGRVPELLRDKLELDPLPLTQLVTGLPPALERLCMRLLAREPQRRPGGEEVLAMLESCSPSAATSLVPAQLMATDMSGLRRSSDRPIFGRDDERLQLRAAVDEVEAGRSATVHVCGPSGAGKSVLVERFLEELEQEPVQRLPQRPLILRGRCYERETVPFKALDAAMEALVTQLSREDDRDVSYALPRGISALMQLFPALGRLPMAQRLDHGKRRVVAAPHAREEAELALRDLFIRLGSRRLVVLWIDDLHWGDLDSARILKSWMGEGGLPGVLLVLSYRSDEISTSPCLRLLLEQTATENMIALGTLGDTDIRALCEQRLSSVLASPQTLAEVADHIVSESEGSPFLAAQLAELAKSELERDARDTRGSLTIEGLVSRRASLLSEGARHLLSLLSVASRPLPVKLARRLSIAGNDSRAALHELSGYSLIRTQDSDGERLVAIYHDRLREAVIASLNLSERAQLDRELLRALEASGGGDRSWLHTLALGAGEADAALRYGQAAAADAMAGLAFERAAELYRACVELAPEQASSELWQKLAMALACSGHGQKAAAAYLEAARRSEGMAALRLERSAASHLLRSGSYEEGEALIQRVLSELDLETPKSEAGLFAAIAWERTRASLRGLRFTPRKLESIPELMAYRGILCGTLSVELQSYDPVRAALFQARSLRYALDAGVPQLIARALCAAATMAAVSGGPSGDERARALLDRASALEREEPSPLVRSNICTARAVCAMLQTRFEEVVEQSGEAERLFREASSEDEGEYYHRMTVSSVRISALEQLGRHVEARAELMREINEARATENVSALLTQSGNLVRLDIMEDQPERAIARLEIEREQLPRQRFGLLHSFYISSVMRIGCATGDTEWALHWMRDDWERFQRSVLKRGGFFSVLWPGIHARLMTTHAQNQGLSLAQTTALIEADMQVLARSSAPNADGALARTRARLALMAGDRKQARELIRQCELSFQKGAFIDEVARATWAVAALSDGAEAERQREAALAAMRSIGYVNPINDIRAYFPELVAELG